MDRKLSVVIATLMLAAVSACNRHDDLPAPGTTAAPAPAAVAPTPAVSPADQAQVQALAYLVAFDEQEVAAAEQARGKKIEADIRAYADRLHEEHSRNLDQTHAIADAAGLTLKDDADVMAYRVRGQADLERMAALDEDEYANAYLEAMAAGHADVLALVDERLLPAASRPTLRQHLQSTRGQVEQQLQAATELKAKHPVKPKPRPKARPATDADASVPPAVAAPPEAEAEAPTGEPATATPPSETDAPADSR